MKPSDGSIFRIAMLELIEPAAAAFSMQASTGPHRSRFNSGRRYFFSLPAVAREQPIGCPVLPTTMFHGDKPTVSVAGQVLVFCHAQYIAQNTRFLNAFI
jgi:hypothetical protein